MSEIPDYNDDGSANPKGDAAYWRNRAEIAEADLARRDDLIKRLVEDGERLIHYAEMFCLGFEDCRCSACGKLVDKGEEHSPDCPITLHRALMKEVEG